MRDDNRGTGRTSEQMQRAPLGALFVWCNGHTGYPRDLAAKLGRNDLEIVSLFALSNSWRYRGRNFTAVVLDHAATPTNSQWENYHQLCAQVRPQVAA